MTRVRPELVMNGSVGATAMVAGPSSAGPRSTVLPVVSTSPVAMFTPPKSNVAGLKNGGAIAFGSNPPKPIGIQIERATEVRPKVGIRRRVDVAAIGVGLH